MGGTIA